MQVRHGARLYPCALAWETPAEAAQAEADAAAAALSLAGADVHAGVHAEAEADADAETQLQAQAPPPGLTARVVLDGNDQGLAVRTTHLRTRTHAFTVARIHLFRILFLFFSFCFFSLCTGGSVRRFL